MKDVRFSKGLFYTNGEQTSVALSNDNIIVEVHKSQNHDTLWYAVGQASVYHVEFGAFEKYDSGTHPNVAVNNNSYVVEVHEGTKDDQLWCRLGQITGDRVDWFPAITYDLGHKPAVAINDTGVVVEVHQSASNHTLWYTVGYIQDKQVKWGKSELFDIGLCPDISIDSQGNVVFVRQAEKDDTLWCRTGVVDGSKINFSKALQYDNGKSPSVGLNDEGTVIEVHKSQNHDTLWSRSGMWTADGVTYDRSIKYDNGEDPAVSCNEEFAIQTHRSGKHHTLFFSPGLIADRQTWMEKEVDWGDTKLFEASLPGTHDAGTFHLGHTFAPSNCQDNIFEKALAWCQQHAIPHGIMVDVFQDWGEAQEENIAMQLDGGIRYFDIRPCAFNNDFYVYHGLLGPLISYMLRDIQQFMKAVNKELVILDLSHFCNFNDDDHAKFVDLIKLYIGDYLYVTGLPNLLRIPVADYIADGPHVLVVYRDDYIEDNPEGGFYKDEAFRIYNEYSNTPYYDEMAKDQLTKYQDQKGGSGKKLFLLSWTLTPDFNTIMLDLEYRVVPFMHHSDLHKLATTANTKLPKFIQDNYNDQYPINIVFTDFYVESGAVDLAIHLSKRTTGG